ncbi:Multidrug and toxin extrusion protein 2 [Acropora cervicornis]|uniref:Multidrug and toxin extrusion protein n=1 Tax=Acropora cervicornis TaxID=6130 RepID=A0AAD9PY46_ACRCE|nr:Multidrug and toxin extrusion protein 2 [Acropora cervicornis]
MPEHRAIPKPRISFYRKILTAKTKRELRQIFKLSWPSVLQYSLHNSLFTISLVFAGRFGSQPQWLAAAVLSMSYIAITGTVIGSGVVTAVEALCAHAYYARDYRLVGVVVQRGIWFLGLAVLLVWALWTNTESLLSLGKQEKETARLSQLFVFIWFPALIADFSFILIQRYLQIQGIFKPIIYVCAFANIMHILTNVSLIYGIDLGFSGVPLAFCVTYCLFIGAATFFYVKYFRLYKRTWPEEGSTGRFGCSQCSSEEHFEKASFLCSKTYYESLPCPHLLFYNYLVHISHRLERSTWKSFHNEQRGRESGQQGYTSYGSICNLRKHTALPLGVTFASYGFTIGLEGFWWGINVGLLFQTIAFIPILKTMDWGKYTKTSLIRMALDRPASGMRWSAATDDIEEENLVASWLSRTSSLFSVNANPSVREFTHPPDPVMSWIVRSSSLLSLHNNPLRAIYNGSNASEQPLPDRNTASAARQPGVHRKGISPMQKQDLIGRRLRWLILALLVLLCAVIVRVVTPVPKDGLR